MDRSNRDDGNKEPLWIIICGLALALVAGGIWIAIDDQFEAKMTRKDANESVFPAVATLRFGLLFCMIQASS